ncbi:MAG: hypothetical protein EPO40_16525 [Myxococcaceae bacterium]|nr:MAG: hypothetical protein EPO40_16525 [Myxococcaceae bacterium]
MSPTLMLIAGLVSLGVGLVSLLAIAVQLGRVLQRQDTAESAVKQLDAAIVTLKDGHHEQDRAIQAVTARIDGQAGDHARAAERVSELRTQFHEMLRTLTALREDVVGRLARIEGYVEHQSAPPPQPSGAFGLPRRPTIPGEPR